MSESEESNISDECAEQTAPVEVVEQRREQAGEEVVKWSLGC